MSHLCKDQCLSSMAGCPSCSVAYEFVRQEMNRVCKQTSDVLHGVVRDMNWTNPNGQIFLSLKLVRGDQTLEQLNNELQIVFFPDRRLGLLKHDWAMNGKIEHETWESLGIVEHMFSKYNPHHQIPTTIYNNDFVYGFRFHCDTVIEWMHSEDYTLTKDEAWTP